MKEIVVASGKGGTGKTTVASSIAFLLAKQGAKIFVVDADVDAPDLSLALGGGETIFSMDVRASKKAIVDVDKCIACGECVKVCPFGAMVKPDGYQAMAVDLMCEGCGTCKLVCPTNAIKISDTETGALTVEMTKYGFGCATGKLKLGEHNSGHLVATLKNIGRWKAQDVGSEVLIVDAAPGIGCPVIASITGADYVVAVTEPTPAAKRNLERLSQVIKHFGVPAGVVINMIGYSKDFEASIRDWVLHELGFQFLGTIPVDYEVIKSLVQMKPIVDFNPGANSSKALVKIAKQIGGFCEAH